MAEENSYGCIGGFALFAFIFSFTCTLIEAYAEATKETLYITLSIMVVSLLSFIFILC